MRDLSVALVLMALCHYTLATWPNSPFQAVNYLLRYGYLKPEYSMQPNPSHLLFHAIENFQENSGLNVTGHLDESTMEQMNKKRCGVPDLPRVIPRKTFIETGIRIHLSKREANQGYWNKTDLTYMIRNYTQDLSKEETDQIIKKALQVWADVSKLTFKRVNNEKSADIVIDFVSGEHGDGVPFDGPGGTLAHAYFPETNTKPIEGDAHFDDDELWIGEDKINGTDLFCTAVHEFGHSLGLAHTFNSEDIMFPFESGCREFPLSQNDIYNIQQLYGKPENKSSTTESQRKTSAINEITLRTEKPTFSSTFLTTTPFFTKSTKKTTLPKCTVTDGIFIDKVTLTPDVLSYFCDSCVKTVTIIGNQGICFFIDSGVTYFDGEFRHQSDLFFEDHWLPEASFTMIINMEQPTISTFFFQGNVVWHYIYSESVFYLTMDFPMQIASVFPHAPFKIIAAFQHSERSFLIGCKHLNRGKSHQSSSCSYLEDYVYAEYHYDCEKNRFKLLEYDQSLSTSVYFREIPKEMELHATWTDSKGYVNILGLNELYIVDQAGGVVEKIIISEKCQDIDVHQNAPRGRKHSPRRGKHSPHKRKHSHHRRRHSYPMRRKCKPYFNGQKYSPHGHRHSPHRKKHSPRGHKRSHRKHKHSPKKHKKSPKRNRHRRTRMK